MNMINRYYIGTYNSAILREQFNHYYEFPKWIVENMEYAWIHDNVYFK